MLASALSCCQWFDTSEGHPVCDKPPPIIHDGSLACRNSEKVTPVNKSSAVAEMGDRAAAIWAKKVRAAVPLSIGTMSLGQSPTSVPSGILIHPAVWPQQTCAKTWGAAVPLSVGRSWVPV